MSNGQSTYGIRPMNVQVKRGSPAETYYRSLAGLPGTEAVTPAEIATGVAPSPAHDLIFHGGKIVPHMTYTNFFVGGQQAWDVADIKRIDRALADAMNDRRLNNVMSQYFPGQQISCTFRPSRILRGPAPAVVSQGDAERLVSSLHAQGLFGNFDLATTIFNLMLPRGTILNTNLTPTGGAVAGASRAGDDRPAEPSDEASSLSGLGGYHGSVHITTQNAGRVTVYYSIGVFSEVRPNGTENGIAVFDEPWKNVVATFYHELNEFRTDPDVGDVIRAGNSPAAQRFLGWTSRQGEEIGDFPIFAADPLTEVFKEVQLAAGSGSIPVQFQYSNAVHGPEGPIPAPH
ncbi:MAG TPA: hypothetical protein VIW80_16160 [Pyrinomonadaceae bacterium]